MHRNVLLPLLTLGMSLACGGKGQQSPGDVDERSSLEDQGPPAPDQRPEVSDDQPQLSDPLLPTTAGDTCEGLCGAGGPDCDPSGCIESCHEGPGAAYAECRGEWQTLFVCAVQHDLFCRTEDITDVLFDLCEPEYVALLRCANLP